MIRNLKEVNDNNFDITRSAEEVRNLSFKDHACIGCGICVKNCPSEAVKVEEFRAIIDGEKCTGCGTCAEKCPKKAIVKT